MKISYKYIVSSMTIIAIIFNIWLVISSSRPWLISSLTIIFHEAGHWIFSLLGHTFMVAGGSIGELLIPILFIFYFWRRQKIPGQIFSWWWLSIALYDISIYVADARSQILPLIGGPGGHDWFFLLNQFHLLEYDFFIARLCIFLMMLVTVYIAILGYQFYFTAENKHANYQGPTLI